MNKGQNSVLKKKKINKLLSKVIVVSIICFILLIVFIVNLQIILKGKSNTLTRIDDLRIENATVVSEIENVEKKSKIAEDYIKIWNTDFLPKQKEFKGINIEELQASIEKLARETKLENLAINFSPVVLAGKDLSKQTIKVYTTLVSIRFTSITDINFFMFLDNLKDEIGYFITIQDINLKRVGKVNQEMLDSLSIGNIVTNVEGDIKVRVYGLGKGRN